MFLINTERIWAINSYIQLKGQVHLRDLMALYPNVSAMTIRRDIDYLERMGHIVRTRGGAKSINHLTHIKEDAYSKRAGLQTEAKMAISSKALELINGTGAVFFDSGTTVMSMVSTMQPGDIFAVTSGPNIAMELCRGLAARTVLLGGNLAADNLSISGNSAIEQLKSINISTAFIATSGYSVGTGFTLGSFDESELKRAVIAKASRVVVLMDISKIGYNLPYTFAHMSDIDFLVCDHAPPAEILEAAEKGNVTVL